ncbi:hypothetical protein ACIRBX_29555 [Kitasatospora sp. NPDC096147]|uniref:hypothetical protein n=1 Tax=Kitasatospora sp. NPDC096147 TaxID=3364093 RepID=UPI003804B2E2
MDSRQDELKRDLDAAVLTRKELGKEYEAEIVDSFLARLDSRLDARVEQRVSEQLDGRRRRGGGEGGGGGGPKLPIVSLALGIPLSGVAGGTGGVWGLVVCWIGIVGVNMANALSSHRPDFKRRRDDW